MRLVLTVVSFFFPLLAVSAEYPEPSTASDQIDVQKELEELGSFDGVWVGQFAPLHDPNGASRQYPNGYPMQITISGEAAELALIEEGDRIDPFPGESLLAFAADGTALIIYIAGSEAYTENWTISLNQVAPGVIKAFISRTVHNIALRRDSPWRVFPQYAVVEFKRK